MKTRSVGRGKPVKVVPIKEPTEYKQKLHNLIERCAYEYYESRGCASGDPVEDWRRAERKVLSSDAHCPMGFIDLDSAFDVQASVGDFTPEDLEVDVEPFCLTIEGDHRPRPVDKPHPIFRVLHLPVEVDPAKVTATLEGGMLHVVLPKRTTAGNYSIKHRAA